VGRSVDRLNLIKNPRFQEGATAPRGWRWIGNGEGTLWRREARLVDAGEVMCLVSRNAHGRAGWCRRVPCKPGKHYHVNVLVSADGNDGAAGGGFFLSVRPVFRSGRPPRRPSRPAVGDVQLAVPRWLNGSAILRGYYHVPPDVRQVEVEVGFQHAAGQVRIHEVMMLEILEPEAKSHVLSAVPPGYAYPPPRQVRAIGVVTRQPQRPLVRLLRRRFGAGAVATFDPTAFQAGRSSADGLLLPDEEPPPGLRGLRALYALAQDRIVVVSLPAFARIAGPAFDVRTIEQADDPIHARIHGANFITRGFAIADVFPHAWRGADRQTFVQRHYRRTAAFRMDFTDRQGYETVLESVCNTDASTGCPICLYKPTDGGGLVVLDVEPAEAEATNFDEPELALYVLLNALGVEQNHFGQYVAPARSERELRDEVAELGWRYPELVVRGSDHPEEPRRDQLVEVGSRQETLGLPVVPRPLILIRTGLSGADADGVYGTLLWLKNLVRPEPHACPHAVELISRYRLAWRPLGAAWHPGLGWQAPAAPEQFELAADFEPGSLAVIIDVTQTGEERVRVAVSDETLRERFRTWLPGLFGALANGRFFGRVGAEACHAGNEMGLGSAEGDRTPGVSDDWGLRRLPLNIEGDANGPFDTDLHRHARQAGAACIRLEFPGPPADLSTSSIWRTDLVATTLELVIGLLYGVMAVNRASQPIRLCGPFSDAGAKPRLLTLRGSEPAAADAPLQPDGSLLLPTAAALCLPMH